MIAYYYRFTDYVKASENLFFFHWREIAVDNKPQNFGAGNTNAKAKREPADDIKHRGPVFFCCILLLIALIFCSIRFNFAHEMGYALNALMLLLATYCLLWRIPKRILLAIAKRNNTDPEAPWRKPGLSRRDQRRELQDYYFPGGTNPEFVIIALVVLMFIACVAGDKNMQEVREEYEEKISIAYEDGYKEGESVGQEEGYIDGYDAAPFYDEGYNEGYDDGYANGYRDGSKTK